MKPALRALLWIGLGAGTLWAQAPAAKPASAALPSAESILDRYVQVTGGKAAYQAHTTEVLKGTIAIAEQGLRGSLTRYAMAPDREYSVFEIDPIGKFETGVIRGYAWSKDAILGPRIKSGEEARQALREAFFNAEIEWRKIFKSASTAGLTTIDGNECYEVVLTPAQGSAEHQFFSKASGLLVRTTMIASSQLGDAPVEVNVGEYKKFGNILYPTQAKQKAAGQEQIITVDSISLNEPIPAVTFEPPEDVAAMIRKAQANPPTAK